MMLAFRGWTTRQEQTIGLAPSNLRPWVALSPSLSLKRMVSRRMCAIEQQCASPAGNGVLLPMSMYCGGASNANSMPVVAQSGRPCAEQPPAEFGPPFIAGQWCDSMRPSGACTSVCSYARRNHAEHVYA